MGIGPLGDPSPGHFWQARPAAPRRSAPTARSASWFRSPRSTARSITAEEGDRSSRTGNGPTKRSPGSSTLQRRAATRSSSTAPATRPTRGAWCSSKSKGPPSRRPFPTREDEGHSRRSARGSRSGITRLARPADRPAHHRPQRSDDTPRRAPGAREGMTGPGTPRIVALFALFA